VALLFRLCGAIALICSLASPFPDFAQATDQSDASEGKPPSEAWRKEYEEAWRKKYEAWLKMDQVIADRDGICVLANPFDHLDPEGFKKHGVNCWFPVFEKNHYII
jgi:hypothetical protein